jgi:archaeal flagellar protein FlaF
MAVSEIIGAAVGILLLVIVAYIVVGSTLTAAETVATAQKDLSLQNEARLGTSIVLNRSEITNTTSELDFSITNNGDEIISDFSHMDIYTWKNVRGQGYVSNVFGTGWTIDRIDPDFIHPMQLDPGEKMWVRLKFDTDKPVWLQVTTDNGVYASTYV